MGKKYDFRPAKGSVKYVVDDTNPDVIFRGFESSGVRRSAPLEPDKGKKVGFFQLFRFADRLDYLIMTIGLIAGIGHGLATQLNLLVLSDTLDKFVEDSQNNSTSSDFLMDALPNIIRNFLLVATMVLICGYIHMMCWCLTSERQIRVIRDLAFRAVLRQHMGWFDRHQSGELNTRLTSDINSIHGGIGDKVATFVQWTSTFVAGTTLCLIRGWKLTLAMLLVTPLGVAIGACVARSLQSFANKELQAYATAGAVSEEVLGNIRTVTAYSGHEREAKRYLVHLKEAKEVGIRRGLVTGTGQGLFWVVVFGTVSFGFWFGSQLIQTDGNMSVGILMQIIISLVGGTRALSFGVSNLDSFSMARGGAAIIYDLIDSKSEIDSSSDEGQKPTTVHGTVKLHSVRFAYPSRPDTLVLDDIDLEINPGQTVALVGSSGCGKSTVVQLIQRFYDPNKGKVTMDDVDLRDLNIRWLRQQIGVVSQEPVLFATSIKENIMFGRDGVTQAEIEQAAKEANAHNFIMTLPEKYNTPVGSKGGQLSGGQKQRIAIARALIRNPKILILDDATSALDYQSEAVVQEALDKARQGRTTLIIAHRLSTIRNADVICVIRNGHIVEKGTHDELMALKGDYETLISRQTTESDSEEQEDGYNEINLYDDTDMDISTSKRGDRPSPIQEEYERQISKVSSRSRSSTGRGSKRSRKRTTTGKSEEEEEEEEEVAVVEEHAEPAALSRIIKLNKPEMPLIVIGCVAAACQGAIFPSIAFFAAEILGAFGDDTDLLSDTVNFYVAILAFCGVGAGIATFLMIFLFSTSGERLTVRLRDMAFRSMMRQEIGWFDDKRNQVGSLTSRLATDASMVKAATGAHLSTVVNATSTIILALTLAFFFGWKLALVCFAFVPLLIGTGIAQTMLLVGFAKGSKQSMEQGGRIISEAIENIRTVASLTKEEYFFQQYNAYFEKAYTAGLKRAQIFGVTWGLSQSMIFYANAANYGFGTYLVARGEMSFENVFRVFVSVASGAVELGRVNAFAADYTKAKVSAAKLFALFERQPLIDPTNTAGIIPRECTGAVSFKRIHFRYPTRPEAKVLQGLTVSVNPGQSLALVGSSGCGKSTTVQMLERFYDPEKGVVLVDGHDTTELNIVWLRSQMGIVAQEPMLFDATIRENIAYGDQSRTVPDQDIITAARQANIHEFVSALPNGYDTEIGAKGVALVGGQKQRIAIARALIRNPKILLLDEATSALDTENEKVVQAALDLAQKGRTSIVIAHRLSTIENADLIAVIDEGQVAEVGRHSELMARKGLYYMLQMIQRGVKIDTHDAGAQDRL